MTDPVHTSAPDPAAALVGPDQRPARRAPDERCPRCGAGSEKRVASCGFGVAHPVCGRCGHEWIDEVWCG